ncbi:MAG: glycoside hydrolase, partial [Muribaculaceae bacterium]|nr:glycoside hydrolase [Muribaculaceae bacterium]
MDNTAINDTLVCWLCLTLKDDAADAHSRINVACTRIKTGDGEVKVPEVTAEPFRVGVALRKPGDDSVFSSRIPGLVTTNNGTLIAMYDARNETDDDLQGDIDIAINRSEDGGRTWQPIQRVLNQGNYGGLPKKYNGVSDGNILVDKTTGDIYVAGLWMHGVLDPKTGEWVKELSDSSTVWNHQWRSGSKSGYGLTETCQFLISKSNDDGKTWSEPRNLTRDIKKKEWWLLAPAPG